MTVDEIQQKLAELNSQLLTAKGRSKRRIKNAIHNYEQMLRKEYRSERVEGRQENQAKKQDWKADLASQGIDPNKGITDSVNKGISTIGSIVSNRQGNNEKLIDRQNSIQRTNNVSNILGTLSESPIMIIAVVGLVGLLMYNIFIKSS